MKNVKAIIDLFGGLASFPHVRLECKGFMPLAVEAIGPGPRQLPMVSVAHYYEQNGDLMKDPEMVFEVDTAGTFHPVSFQEDNLGIFHEAVFTNDTGQVMVRPRPVNGLVAFARQWDKNLKEKGFVDAARAEAQRRAAAE